MANITIDNLTYDTNRGIFTRNGSRAGGNSYGGYRTIVFRKKRMNESKLAWFFSFGEFPKEGYILDHKNGVRDDNRVGNLRIVTRAENNRNVAMGKNNTSGVTGVSFNRNTNTWRARVLDNGKRVEVGSFQTKEQATQAIRKAYATLGFYERHGRKPQY